MQFCREATGGSEIYNIFDCGEIELLRNFIFLLCFFSITKLLICVLIDNSVGVNSCVLDSVFLLVPVPFHAFKLLFFSSGFLIAVVSGNG